MSAFSFIAAGSRSVSASATALTPTLTVDSAFPHSVRVAVCQVRNNNVISTVTPGWTKLFQRDSGPSFTAAVFIAPMAAANPVFTWATAAACVAQQAYYFSTSGIPVTNAVGNSSVNSGLVNPHTSASITSTRFNSLAIFIDVSAANTFFTAPAGWTENVNTGSVTADMHTVWGSRQLGAVGSTTGNISTTGANAAWVQWQIELITELPAPGLQVAENEIVPWISPDSGLAIAENEIVPWISPDSGLAIAENEIVPWISPNSGLAIAENEIVPWISPNSGLSIAETEIVLWLAPSEDILPAGVQARGLLGAVDVQTPTIGVTVLVTGVQGLGQTEIVDVSVNRGADAPVSSVTGVGLLGFVRVRVDVDVYLAGVQARGRVTRSNVWLPVDDSQAGCGWSLVDETQPGCGWSPIDDSQISKLGWDEIPT